MSAQTLSTNGAEAAVRDHGTVVSGAPSHAAADGSKQTFIRATEIWLPTRDRRQLELGSGLYGPLSAFEAVSRDTRFDCDVGLPGKAWAAGHPIVLKNLTDSYFKRGEAAKAAGLTCAVALPIFAGRRLMAVIVLFCGDDREHVGAIEVWHTPPDSIEMGLVDGYYGTAEVLEWSSRHVKFMRGIGLPGQTWDTGMPVIMEDLGRSRRFLRWESAERVGLNRGVGIPCGRDGEGVWVLTFLSALGTPIARRFEVWVPDMQRDGLVFAGGYCEHVSDLGAAHESTALPRWAGTLGHVWQSGAPGISTDLSKEPEPIAVSAEDARLATMVAMPVITDGALKAIVAWYL